MGALLLSSVPACGDDALIVTRLDAVPYVSGQRLRADLVGVAGAEILIGWWDTKLSTHCSFGHDERGDIRCLPGLHRTAGLLYRDRALNVNGAAPLVGLRFLDADCTVPVHVSPPGVPAPPYAAGAEDVVPCVAPPEVRYRMHRVGAPRTVTTLYQSFGGDCVADPAGEGEVVYDLEEVVDPGMFVPAEKARATWPSGLEVVVVKAADGARQAVFAIDGRRDAACWGANYYGKNDGLCLPMLGRVAFLGGDYTDETCTSPVGYDRADPTCGPPLVVFELAEGLIAYETGDAVDEAAVYTSSLQTGCTPAAPDGKRYFRHGPLIPDATFPTLRSSSSGDGVVTAQVITDEAGTPIRSVGLLSTGEHCTPQTNCDGMLRCVPHGLIRGPTFDYFADDTCTEPLVRFCDAPEILIATSRDPATCDDDAPYGPIVTAGPQHEGAVYRLDGSGDCLPFEGTDCFSTLGSEADLSGLPILERHVE